MARAKYYVTREGCVCERIPRTAAQIGGATVVYEPLEEVDMHAICAVLNAYEESGRPYPDWDTVQAVLAAHPNTEGRSDEHSSAGAGEHGDHSMSG